jgi:hypothetical protein
MVVSSGLVGGHFRGDEGATRKPNVGASPKVRQYGFQKRDWALGSNGLRP